MTISISSFIFAWTWWGHRGILLLLSKWRRYDLCIFFISPPSLLGLGRTLSLDSLFLQWRSSDDLFFAYFFSFFFILDMVEHTEVYSLIFFNGDDMTISFGLDFMTFDDQLLDGLKQEDYHNGIHQIIINSDHSRMKWNYYWFYRTLIEIVQHNFRWTWKWISYWMNWMKSIELSSFWIIIQEWSEIIIDSITHW